MNKWLSLVGVSSLAALALQPAVAAAATTNMPGVVRVSIQETPSVVQHSRFLGTVAANRELDVTLYLKSANPTGLAQYAQAVLHHKVRPLTHAADMRIYGPNANQRTALEAWLKAQHDPVTVIDHGAAIETRMNVATAEATFHTSLNRYQYHGTTYQSPSTSVNLSGPLADVLYVGGLDTYHPVINPGLVASPGVYPKATGPNATTAAWLLFRKLLAPQKVHYRHAPAVPLAMSTLQLKTASIIRTNAISANGQALSNDQVTLSVSQPTSQVNQSTTLTANVIDQNGDPVSGATVALTQEQIVGNSAGGVGHAVVTNVNGTGIPASAGETVEGTTDSNGNITFTVTDANNELVAFSAGVTPAPSNTSLPAAVTSPVTMYGTTPATNVGWYQAGSVTVTPVNTSVPAGQNISATVTVDSSSGSPIPGAQVYLDLPSGQTAYSGGTNSTGVGITTANGQTSLWIDAPSPYTGPLEAWAMTADGELYEGQSTGTVAWTGSPVVYSNPEPGSTSGATVLGATPSEVNAAYNATQLANQSTDTQATIGIYAESLRTPGDISTYFQGLGITPPTINVVPVDGSSNDLAPVPGWRGELELDIERAGSAAPGAKITLYTLAQPNSQYSNPDPVDVVTQAVNQAHPVSVMSFSMGMPEDSMSAGYAQAWDQEFQLGNAEGMTFVVASGDGGAYEDPSNPSVVTPSFPATDPNVTAVGGTQLGIDASTNAIDSEYGWSPDGSWNGVPAASGGGYSGLFSVPSWQSNAVPSTAVGRGVPDVAFMATTPYYLMYDSNDAGLNSNGNITSWIAVGGTSASTPTFAGYLADIAAVAGPLGNINKLLYQHAGSSALFNTIAAGNNGAYTVNSGTNVWNPVTGLGSVNIADMVGLFDPAVTSVTPSPTQGQTVTVQGQYLGSTPGTVMLTDSNNITWSTVSGSAHLISGVTWSPSSVTFTLPTGVAAGSATLLVTRADGKQAPSQTLTIASPPEISTVSATSPSLGSSVTITGTGFGTTMGSVVLTSGNGTTTVSPTTWSDTSVTFTVPITAAAGAATVTVKTVSNSVTSPYDLTLTGGPIITSANLPGAAQGQLVTLNGTDFGSQQGSGYLAFHDHGINWGAPGNAAPFDILNWTNTQIQFVVPTPAGPNGVWAVTPGTIATASVHLANGETSAPFDITIQGAPTITGVSPSSAGAGDLVTVTGSNFGAVQDDSYLAFHDNGVNWGAPGNAAPFQIVSWSNTQIVFAVPTASGPNNAWAVTPGTTATLSVTTGSISTSPAASLAVTNPIPQITAISPTTVSTGTDVTIIGTDFGATKGSGYVHFADNGINWGEPSNSAAFTIVRWGNTRVVFQVPNPSGPNNVWAVTPGTTASVTVVNSQGETSSSQSLSVQ